MNDFAFQKFALIQSVIDQIKLDLANNDETAIEEMLAQLDNEVLQAYLPEKNIGSLVVIMMAAA